MLLCLSGVGRGWGCVTVGCLVDLLQIASEVKHNLLSSSLMKIGLVYLTDWLNAYI